MTSDCYALKWESQHLKALGKSLGAVAGSVAVKGGLSTFAKAASKKAASTIAWPLTVLKVLSLIDNPWSVAKIRAEEGGLLLAKSLMNRVKGNRPVSLIGFSLGARLIFSALEELARRNSLGIIDHAVLMGGAFSADENRWRQVRSVVAGRLVNAYSNTDNILRYLYRATEFKCPAGLAPINVPGVENINVGHIAKGHLDYMEKLEDLFRFLDIDGIHTSE